MAGHATRIVFSRLISTACRRRSLRSQVLGLLFARQKVATAETAHRRMHTTTGVYVYVWGGRYVCMHTLDIRQRVHIMVLTPPVNCRCDCWKPHSPGRVYHREEQSFFFHPPLGFPKSRFSRRICAMFLAASE